MTKPPGIQRLPNGQWVIAGDTHLSKWAGEHGSIVTDPHLFAWLKPRLQKVKTVWDVGANIGDHTRQYLDWGMEVFAFEPNPSAYKCLQHNCPEAICMNVAASDAHGLLPFASYDNAGASRVSEHGSLQVEARALDDIEGLAAPDFIKLDIEGFEAFAIYGMAGTITRHKPIIFCEFNLGALVEQKCSPEGLRDLIESLGYRMVEVYPPEANWLWPQCDCLFLPTP